MVRVALPRMGFAQAWRNASRDLLHKGVRPMDVIWVGASDEAGLFDLQASEPASLEPVASPSVPKAFLPLAGAAVCHSGRERFSLPYRILWRLQSNRGLLSDRADADVSALFGMEKSVRRDNHKMHAFVRFRELGVSDAGRRQFGAWFEPQHHIVELAAPFFVRRFADMDWTIATPDLVARFENGRLSIEPCEVRPDLPEDTADELWRTYFASIFNPARLKVKAMKSEMPVKYWKNMPEARLIPELIAGADKAAREMQDKMPNLAHPRTERIVKRLPLTPEAEHRGDIATTIAEARKAAATCTRCDLTNSRHKTYSARGRRMPKSCLLANNRVTRKI